MAIELGGDITLEGFSDVDGGELIVVKKIVGRYARKITDLSSKCQGLKVSMKPLHKTEKNEKYEIHASVGCKGKVISSEVTERNLFIGLDAVLKKIVSQITS